LLVLPWVGWRALPLLIEADVNKDQGTLLEKTAHEKCGSSDALAVYEHEDGRIDGYCWSCGAYEADPYGTGDGKQMTAHNNKPYQHRFSIQDVYALRCEGLPHRGLRPEIAKYFDIRTEFDQMTGTQLQSVYYPGIKHGQITGYKERSIASKSFSAVGDMKGVELFGQGQAKATGSRWLYITEGEDDAMILFQALLDNTKGTKYEAYLPAVVSVPAGAGGVVRALSAQQGFLDSFDEIILVLDNDEPGQEAVSKALQILPLQKVKIASLPMKDACAMYEAGRGEELVKIVKWKTTQPKIASVATAKDIKQEAKNPPVWGEPWPWKTLTDLTYGIRQGIIGVGAGVGVGKSSIWHQTQQKLIFDGGAKVGLFMLEEPNDITLKKLAGKQVGLDFTSPEGGFTQQQLEDAIDLIPDEVCIYRHRGTKDWEDVKQALKHMVLVENVKYIFVDPLTALVAHLSSSEANDELNKIFSEIAGLIEDLHFTFMYGAHLNPPKVGASHEEGGRVTLAQFTGSKAMIKWSHYIFGAERNTQADNAIERNTLTFRVLKDRDFGRTGTTFPLSYDPSTGRLLEKQVGVTQAGQPPAY
jgi:hypothetical protein